MSECLLTRYVSAGLPHLKQIAKLSEWFLPGLAEETRKFDDECLIKMAEPLGLSEKLQTALSEAPEPENLPVEKWRESIDLFNVTHQVRPVILSLQRALEKFEAFQRRGNLKVDPSLVRGLAVIAYAPFALTGQEILQRLSVALGGSNNEPAGLMERYVNAVIDGDRKTLTAVDGCIQADPIWAEWTQRFIAIGKSSPFTPRIIGISPCINPDLTQVLVSMLTESG